MNIVMQDFLSSTNGSSFGKNAPRPPVPGGETDSTAATHNCAASTRSSSSSHRSHVSSSKSLSSGKSAVQQSSVVSPAATPRKSNLDRTLTGKGGAPLGFEPEGSVSGSPQFAETSTPGVPPCLRWAENLRCLLEDGEGVKLFKLFLDQELATSAALDFWFACSGLKLVSPINVQLVLSLVKLIYKKYVKPCSGDLKISSEIKQCIVERLRRKQVDQTIYDAAQLEVENSMREETYPLFLKSEIYLTYVQHGGGESPKTSNNSSGSDGTRPLLGLLPTLHEELELRNADIQAIPSEPNLSLTETSLVATQKVRNVIMNPPRHGSSSTGRVPNPYYNSYAPVTAQDSEIQSLSSDAMTDDAISYTDSSVEGNLQRGHKSGNWKKQHSSMQTYAATNQHTGLSHRVIPRTDRAPRDRNLAENDPERFSSLIIDRLQRLKDDEMKLERIHEVMRNMELSTSSIRSPPRPARSSVSIDCSSIQSIGSFPPELFLSTSELDDSAQSILEHHVSRVWDNSIMSSTSHPDDAPYHQMHHRVGRYPPVPPTANNSVFDSSFYPHSAATAMLARPVRMGSALSSSTSTFDSGFVRDDGRHGSVGGYMDTDYDAPLYSGHDRHRQQRYNEYLMSDARTHHSRGGVLPPQLQSTPRGVKGGHSMSRAESERFSNNNRTVCTELNFFNDDEFKRPTVDTGRGGGGRGMMGGSIVSLPACEVSSYQPDSRSNHDEPCQQRSNRNEPCQQRTMQWLDDSRSDVSHLYPTSSFPAEDDSKFFVSKRQPPKMPSYPDKFSSMCRMLPPPSSAQPPVRSTSSVAQHSPLDLSASDMSYYQQQYQLSQGLQPQSQSNYSSHPSSQLQQRPANHRIGNNSSTEVTVVGYKFCDEDIPYRTTVSGRTVTLGQFKQLITKKGNFRYFFKKACDEFDSGVVHEEVFCDGDVLPLYEGKIFGKVEKRQ